MSEVNLPEGWTITTLESLTTDISYGYTASSSPDEVGPKMLRITDIQDKSVFWPDVPYCKIEEDRIEKYLLKKNDLVFARTGATVGKSFLLRTEPPKAVYASYLIRVRTASEELISVLSHFFNSEQYWQQITEFSAGIGQPNVNGTKLRGLTIPLPPLAEQKVIADKLDTLLAQVETTKARLDRIPKILKTFRQSVLAAAVSGKLTEEWRGELSYCEMGLSLEKADKSLNIPTVWSKTILSDSCKVISGNAFKSQDFLNEGEVPAIKISNVQYGQFEVKNQQFLPIEYLKTYKNFVVNEGDVLMALTRPITNDTLKVCRYPSDQPTGLLNQRVAKFIFKNESEKSFFEILFQSDYFKFQILDKLSETLQPNLSPVDLKKFIIASPNELEQTEIVRRVEELFAFADSIEQKANAALERVNNLTQSILAKAFRGELTADWRAANPELISGENSAEALLAKIQAERDKLALEKK
ncbi:restriction endonuclease subunit S, partial [Thalassolituus oleivorans]|uniref:restriction endonuclease subunit S n=1 Tax=Thalassolituus oleivorans TaxID=187493 RepID=UPI0030C7D030